MILPKNLLNMICTEAFENNAIAEVPDQVGGRMTIWKYQLEIADEQYVEMPAGARVLCVQVQFGAACIWAMVDPLQPAKERRLVRIVGTGHTCECDLGVYVGTFKIDNGNLVFHVFIGGRS